MSPDVRIVTNPPGTVSGAPAVPLGESSSLRGMPLDTVARGATGLEGTGLGHAVDPKALAKADQVPNTIARQVVRPKRLPPLK